MATRKVMVLWADEKSPNLGVRALAQGSEQLAKLAWGDDVEVLLQDFAGKESGVPFGAKSIVRDFFRRKGSIKSLIREYHIVLDTGAGDSFADIYGLKRFLTIFYIQWLTLRLGKPLVMTPQTIGPFDTRIGRSAAKFILPRLTQVAVRDSISLETAISLGCTSAVEASDMVFMLPHVERLQNKHDVVVNISGLLWEPNMHIDSQIYQRSSIELIDSLRESGRAVTLPAHVLDGPSKDYDVRAIEQLQNLLEEPCEVVIPKDLPDARNVLAQSNIVIGARMHACLNAISVGTPAVPWAYSRKFAPLLDQLGWTSVVDLRTSLNIVAETLDLIEILNGMEGFVLAQKAAHSGLNASRQLAQLFEKLELVVE